MSDLISRQDALNCIKKLYAGHTACNMFEALDAVAEYIEEVPSAERKGRWIKQHGYYDGDVYYECSECGEEFCFLDGCTPEDNLHFYCPNCGARMEGEEE